MVTLYSYFGSASSSEPKRATESDSETDSVDGVDRSVGPPSKKVYKRSFSSVWLEKFVWLRYDARLDRMCCKYCEQSNKANTYTSGCKNFRISDIQSIVEVGITLLLLKRFY